MDTIKNIILVPILQFFSSIQAYLPFDLMKMLGLSAAVAVATSSATFDLNTLADKMDPFTVAIGGAALKGSAASNPTTGYEWMIDVPASCGPEGSVIVEKTFVRHDNADENITGIGGTDYFSITATDKAKSGSTCNVGFNHDQPWNAQKGWEAKPYYVIPIQIV